MGEEQGRFQQEFDARRVAREGRRDGRGWGWTAVPPFMIFDRSAMEIIAAGQAPPFIRHVAGSAEEAVAEICRSWCDADGEFQVAGGQSAATRSALATSVGAEVSGDRQLQVRKRLQLLTQQREASWKSHRADAMLIIKKYADVCQTYRGSFFRARGRGGKGSPDWNDPVVALPEEFVSIRSLLEELEDGST